MTRTASLILSLAAFCLTATAVQAAAPCCGTVHSSRFSDDATRTTASDDGTVHSSRMSDERTADTARSSDDGQSDTLRSTKD